MTKASDDAGQRISRFLLMQLIVNATVGLSVGFGLLAIGIEYAFLWGFPAAVFRYIPYIGVWIAAVPPVILSLAMFEGWVQPLLVFGLFVAIELLANNVAEPRLYGQSIGISEVALLVAAAFWGFLWGPIGLVLSSPLTVCLVVLGKYVPQLKFLDVLLGDEPPLDAHLIFYQRLLAGDQDEATQLVLAQAKASSPEQVYDDFLVPALNYVKRDRERDDLTESDEQSVLQTTREILEDLGERREVVTQAEEAIHAENRGNASAPIPLRVLACPGRDQADRLALEMLRQLLGPAKWAVEIASAEMMASDLVAQVAEQVPALVGIGALPPEVWLTHATCARIASPVPGVKIVVGGGGLPTAWRRPGSPGRRSRLTATTSWETEQLTVCYRSFARTGKALGGLRGKLPRRVALVLIDDPATAHILGKGVTIMGGKTDVVKGRIKEAAGARPATTSFARRGRPTRQWARPSKPSKR